ncbi:hypothetical protein D3C83_17880 [compost metagenome]
MRLKLKFVRMPNSAVTLPWICSRWRMSWRDGPQSTSGLRLSDGSEVAPSAWFFSWPSV